MLLNTDTITKKGAFDSMVEFMDSHPKAGACGPKLLNTNGTIQHQGGMLGKKFWLYKYPTKISYMIGACIMARREVIDQVGGLDENFFFSNDDLDWCKRITKAGWDIYFIPQAEVIHHGGYTINKFNQMLFIEGFRGGLYFCKKHYGNIAYQIYRILLIFAILVATIFSAILYPFLKNKEKLPAFFKILMLSLKGEIISPHERG